MPEYPLISIIVPVYNAEKYLRQCVESVLAQTYCNWELILVDDGSSDASPGMCDLAAGQDDRIRVIHRQNGGVSVARNVGLEHIRGRFVAFLDADDLLHPRFLDVCLEILLRDDADIVSCDINRFQTGVHVAYPDVPDNIRSVSAKKLSGHDACLSMLYQEGLEPSPCGKLFSTALWGGERFREGIRYEDLDLIPLIFRKANKVTITSLKMYLYRQHEDSYLHRFNLGRTDVLNVTERLVRVTADDAELNKAALDRQLSANFNILALMASEGHTLSENERAIGKKFATSCWKKIKELRGRSLRNPNVRLKNKLGIIASYIGGRRLINLLARL